MRSREEFWLLMVEREAILSNRSMLKISHRNYSLLADSMLRMICFQHIARGSARRGGHAQASLLHHCKYIVG